uniref:Uncharacterized protein n=1 Tax=Anguilla anguilla TaxID=7936 RepID=A0A0E9UF81_ANGAN
MEQYLWHNITFQHRTACMLMCIEF